TIWITPLRMATSVKPDFLAGALQPVVVRPGKIQVRELRHENINVADEFRFDGFDDSDVRRGFANTFHEGSIRFFLMDERFIREADEDAAFPAASFHEFF